MIEDFPDDVGRRLLAASLSVGHSRADIINVDSRTADRTP